MVPDRLIKALSVVAATWLATSCITPTHRCDDGPIQAGDVLHLVTIEPYRAGLHFTYDSRRAPSAIYPGPCPAFDRIGQWQVDGESARSWEPFAIAATYGPEGHAAELGMCGGHVSTVPDADVGLALGDFRHASFILGGAIAEGAADVVLEDGCRGTWQFAAHPFGDDALGPPVEGLAPPIMLMRSFLGRSGCSWLPEGDPIGPACADGYSAYVMRIE
jgi:hypothetical protein